MSDLSIAPIGSTAKPAYPLFTPAGAVAPSVSALDPYFQALDQTPTPSPGGQSDPRQPGGQNPGSAFPNSANTSPGLAAQSSKGSLLHSAGPSPAGPSGSVTQYIPAGPGRATVLAGAVAASGQTVDTYA